MDKLTEVQFVSVINIAEVYLLTSVELLDMLDIKQAFPKLMMNKSCSITQYLSIKVNICRGIYMPAVKSEIAKIYLWNMFEP